MVGVKDAGTPNQDLSAFHLVSMATKVIVDRRVLCMELKLYGGGKFDMFLEQTCRMSLSSSCFR